MLFKSPRKHLRAANNILAEKKKEFGGKINKGLNEMFLDYSIMSVLFLYIYKFSVHKSFIMFGEG